MAVKKKKKKNQNNLELLPIFTPAFTALFNITHIVAGNLTIHALLDLLPVLHIHECRDSVCTDVFVHSSLDFTA